MNNVKAIEILRHSNELLLKQIDKLREIPSEQASCMGAYDSLKMCEEEYAAVDFAISALQAPRRFLVSVPEGTLKVQAKHDYERPDQGEDNPMDFPGIYVDLVRPGHDDVLIACIEYESSFDYLQACVYGDILQDEPTHVIRIEHMEDESV
ncbi:hypothetical protein [Oscillibacter ruminantium]